MRPDLLLQPCGALSHQPFHPLASAARNKWPEAETVSPARKRKASPSRCLENDWAPPPLLPPGGIQEVLRGRIRGQVGQEPPVDSIVGARAEDLGGIGPERLCAWMTWTGVTYLEPVSLQDFSLPLCEMGTELTKPIYLFNKHLLGTSICQTLVQELEQKLETSASSRSHGGYILE